MQFFDTIDHELLLRRLEERISDGRLLSLMRLLLKQKVLEGEASWEPEDGTPQGGVISPLLANVFLNPLDWALLQSGVQSVRYADDMVMLCRGAAYSAHRNGPTHAQLNEPTDFHGVFA